MGWSCGSEAEVSEHWMRQRQASLSEGNHFGGFQHGMKLHQLETEPCAENALDHKEGPIAAAVQSPCCRKLLHQGSFVQPPLLQPMWHNPGSSCLHLSPTSSRAPACPLPPGACDAPNAIECHRPPTRTGHHIQASLGRSSLMRSCSGIVCGRCSSGSMHTGHALSYVPHSNEDSNRRRRLPPATFCAGRPNMVVAASCIRSWRRRCARADNDRRLRTGARRRSRCCCRRRLRRRRRRPQKCRPRCRPWSRLRRPQL